MRLFSDLISVMIHRDAAVRANHWIGFSHFNNFNEAERSPGRIAATPDPHYFLEEFVNPSRICQILDLTILIEEVGNFREVAVPESANQTKLADDQQQTPEDARAAKTARETLANSDRFADDVFLVGIPRLLTQKDLVRIRHSCRRIGV